MMPATSAPDTSSLALQSSLVAIARDIKLSHSVFALPFALLSMFLAAGSASRWPSLTEVALILVCMVLARTMAMTMNRWADASLDAANPRTAGRAIPSGRVRAPVMLGASVACALTFVVAAGGFWLFRGNVWPVLLSPLVLAWLAGYSFTKRFTALCHVYLGSALALSPLAAAIAIEPGHLAQPEPWLLAIMVTCWVAGFDILYALQDVDVDRVQGIFSMPARLGVEAALWVSRGLHLGAAAALLLLSRSSPQLGPWFLTAALVAVGLLALEHALVWRSRTRHLHHAFLTINGIISLLLAAAGIADIMFSHG